MVDLVLQLRGCHVLLNCLGTLIELNYNIPEKCRIDLLTLPGYFICINYWNAVALKDFGYCTFTCGDTTSYCHNEHL